MSSGLSATLRDPVSSSWLELRPNSFEYSSPGGETGLASQCPPWMKNPRWVLRSHQCIAPDSASIPGSGWSALALSTGVAMKAAGARSARSS